MDSQQRWLLPAGIIEILPTEARQIEKLRRHLLDLFSTWGYELVIPPLIEYLDSLLLGAGRNLDLQTFKLTDQLTGKLMGVRADMTPQVARIDMHHLKRDVPTRLCYLETVLHTRPNRFAGSRTPIQVGAELFGHAGIESDAEVLALMLACLQQVGIEQFHIDVGHVKIYQALFEHAQFNEAQASQLFKVMKRKAREEMQQLLQAWQVDSAMQAWLLGLVQLHGDESILSEAKTVLATAPFAVHQALDDLIKLSDQLSPYQLHFDLAESRGYSYHTGVVFAAYVPKYGEAIAKGGRYDDISGLFGYFRPATGFSANLATLVRLISSEPDMPKGIFAPPLAENEELSGLVNAVNALRARGHRVICALPGQTSQQAEAMGCDRELRYVQGEWQVVPVVVDYQIEEE